MEPKKMHGIGTHRPEDDMIVRWLNVSGMILNDIIAFNHNSRNGILTMEEFVSWFLQTQHLHGARLNDLYTSEGLSIRALVLILRHVFDLNIKSLEVDYYIADHRKINSLSLYQESQLSHDLGDGLPELRSVNILGLMLAEDLGLREYVVYSGDRGPDKDVRDHFTLFDRLSNTVAYPCRTGTLRTAFVEMSRFANVVMKRSIEPISMNAILSSSAYELEIHVFDSEQCY